MRGCGVDCNFREPWCLKVCVGGWWWNCGRGVLCLTELHHSTICIFIVRFFYYYYLNERKQCWNSITTENVFFCCKLSFMGLCFKTCVERIVWWTKALMLGCSNLCFQTWRESLTLLVTYWDISSWDDFMEMQMYLPYILSRTLLQDRNIEKAQFVKVLKADLAQL